MYQNFAFVIETVMKDGKLFVCFLRTPEGRIIDIRDGESLHESIEKVLVDFIDNVQAR